MGVYDPYRKNTDGTPSEYKTAFNSQTYKSKQTIIVVTATIVAVISLVMNIFLLEVKTDKNIAKLNQYELDISNLSHVVDENRIVIRTLNEQFKKNTAEINETRKNLATKEKELVAVKDKLATANELINNLSSQLDAKENELKSIKNRIQASTTASQLIKKCLKVISSYGYRLKRGELQRSLSRKHIESFSNEDKKKLQSLYDKFEVYDTDQNNSLNDEEVALSVFK